MPFIAPDRARPGLTQHRQPTNAHRVPKAIALGLVLGLVATAVLLRSIDPEISVRGLPPWLEGASATHDHGAPRVQQIETPAARRNPSLPPPRVVDEKPQRILIVGDSMVYNLLPLIADYCLENGHSLHPAIWWGSTSMGWAGTDKLTQLLSRHKPTFVLFVLGSSEIMGKGIKRFATAAVERLLTRVGDRKVAWIGPPNWRPDTGINDALAAALPAGTYFRSAELELERESDGIHPTRAGGRAWAQHFVRWLAEESSVPILLQPPTAVAKVPGATCYGAAWEQ